MPNFKKFLNKKVIFVFVFVLILAIGGFFWWQNREIKGSPEDYVIKETEEGIFVENKKAGLTVKAPEGWEVKGMKPKEGWVMFFSPETEIKWKEEDVVLLPLIKGCIIETVVMYREMDFLQLKLETRYFLAILGLKSVEFEEIIINNRPALKAIFDTEKVGPGIAVDIPQNGKVYTFNLMWGGDEKERCIQEFDSFLETISIY